MLPRCYIRTPLHTGFRLRTTVTETFQAFSDVTVSLLGFLIPPPTTFSCSLYSGSKLTSRDGLKLHEICYKSLASMDHLCTVQCQ